MATKLFDPGQVSLSWNGIIISGYIDGTMIEAERYEDSNHLKVGADGEALRIRGKNKSGSIKFTLLQSASANDLLSAILAADELMPLVSTAVVTTGAISLVDNSGSTKISATDAWIKKWAKVTYGKEAEGREWTLETGLLTIFVGSN